MRRLWLLAPVALGVAGCIVVVQSSSTPTAPVLLIPTSTPPPTLTPASYPTVLDVSTATVSPASTPAPLPTGTSVSPSPTLTQPPGATPVSTSIPISITAFTLTPAEIRPGEALTLTWSVVAEQVALWQLDALGRLSVSYTAPISGSLVIVTPDTLRNHVDFVLFANTGASSAQAFVSAKITCPDVWFFANPPGGCPGSPPHSTVMQAEHFEHGMMLWTQWNDFIYILYSDTQFSPRWDARQNAWFPGMPEDDPALLPPAGYFQPVRGFGVAWRDEQAAPGFRVRDRLGWATDQEFSVSDAAYQCDSAPKYNTCYLTGPGNAVFALQPERSGWNVWTGPTPAP